MHPSPKIFLALACLLSSQTLFAAEWLVLKSNSPDLKPGILLTGSASLVLGQGTYLTLISPAGTVVRFAGPFNGRPDSGLEAGKNADRKMIDILRRLIAPDATDTPIIGSTRGQNADLWRIELVREGIHCMASDESPELSRADPRASLLLEVARVGEGGSKATVRFAEGQRTAFWPAAIPLRDGETYRFRAAGALEPHAVTVRLIPALPGDPHRAAWMAEHGCVSQARRLLERLR
jgi:hypothetical protein